ncbi:MAG: ATP-binding cassette domain-containing protein [Desulfobacteraceae bacterium]|jgi:ATP-binding cassette subfamily F protein uup
MALIGMREVCWGFGDPPLLENLTFQIGKGERVGLLGRNGVGKSSLLKLLAGDIVPDSGEVWRQQGVTVAALEQEVPAGCQGTLFDVVAAGLGEKGRMLAEYNRICREPEDADHPALTRRRNALQHRLDAEGGWELLRQTEKVLSQTGLDRDGDFASLSAGMKRRTLFARALARDPDVLLLDEPTNHLDIAAILWLETFILRNVKTLLVVTHDRALLQRLATRILELDRGRVASYACDYPTYLARREAALEAEEKQSAVFDKKLSQEEVWIRQGIKARRTRNEGRVKALQKLREAHRARRHRVGSARLAIQEAEKTGKLVMEARGITFALGDRAIIRDFSTVVMRGDKIGIIGPNGAGKTTLLKLLLGELAPTAGLLRRGTNLQVAYFDQLRDQLDPQRTVQQNIAQGNDFIEFNGQRRHVIGYLQDFLFSPQRCRTPVWVLSGGEKNRLLLAKLFTRPANVLVLDEPTNDLDAETLELLEELLFEFSGTLLLVSHDRAFLNNVVTGTLVFEDDGRVAEYPGGYDDWLRQRPAPAEAAPPEKKTRTPARSAGGSARKTGLGFKEKHELEALPRRIEALEAEQRELYAAMSDPLFYKKEKGEITAFTARLEAVERDVQAAYRRWEVLEELKGDAP